MRSVRIGFGLLFLASAVVCSAAEDVMLKYLPTGTEYVVSADADALRKLPFVRNLLTSGNSDLKAYRENFERDYNLRLEDCSRLLWVGGGKRIRGMLAETRIPESALAARFRRFGDRFSISAERGRKLYCLESTDSIPAARTTVALTYLTPGLVLATEQEYIAPFLNGLTAPGSNRLRQIRAPRGTPPAWSFINVGALTSGKKKQKSFADVMLRGVRTIEIEFQPAADGFGWRLSGIAWCRDASQAAMVSMQVPMLLQLGAGLLFADDPALGADLLRRVKIAPDRDLVRFELDVSKSLAGRLGIFLENEAKKRIAPPDPVLLPEPVAAGHTSGTTE